MVRIELATTKTRWLSSFGAAWRGSKPRSCIRYTIFSHHYTTHWFVALHFLYSVCGVAFFYTLHCRVKMVKSWNNGAEKPWARSTDTPATTALHPLLWFSFSLYIYKLEQKRKATWVSLSQGIAPCCVMLCECALISAHVMHEQFWTFSFIY